MNDINDMHILYIEGISQNVDICTTVIQSILVIKVEYVIGRF